MQKMTELEKELMSRLELADEYIEALLAENKKLDTANDELLQEKSILFVESANKDGIIEQLNKNIADLKAEIENLHLEYSNGRMKEGKQNV